MAIKLLGLSLARAPALLKVTCRIRGSVTPSNVKLPPGGAGTTVDLAVWRLPGARRSATSAMRASG
jgi:hypothetical protein